MIEADDEADEIELTDPENIDDISELDTVSGADIVGEIAQSGEGGEMFASAEEAGEPEFSRDDWQLVLVNKNHPIADDYTFTLGTIKGSMQCDERIIPDLFSMLEAALNDGVNLVICSPYRDDSRQQMLFDRKVNKYTAQGMSYLEAYKVAAQTVTIPGSSEHQIGLAIDMISDNYSSLNAGFGDTPAGKWLAGHAHEYGFIIRYPEGKEDITGIEYEPWHLRYVGKNAAWVLYNESITLEEFWEKYL
ncbi:MAG: M15 family metallopeptidase [Lachnospiraceae bacterium]|nr:M15 family metallopeptidase [Lachnospiraceae bacterium]